MQAISRSEAAPWLMCLDLPFEQISEAETPARTFALAMASCALACARAKGWAVVFVNGVHAPRSVRPPRKAPDGASSSAFARLALPPDAQAPHPHPRPLQRTPTRALAAATAFLFGPASGAPRASAGEGWASLRPQADELCCLRPGLSAFSAPGLRAQVARCGAGRVFLVGAVYCQAGLASVLAADEAGLCPTIVEDGCFPFDPAGPRANAPLRREMFSGLARQARVIDVFHARDGRAAPRWSGAYAGVRGNVVSLQDYRRR